LATADRHLVVWWFGGLVVWWFGGLVLDELTKRLEEDFKEEASMLENFFFHY